jgi:hypothetical protein
MKKVGCVLALVGLAVFCGSVLLLFDRLTTSRQGALSSLSLEPGKKVTGELVAPRGNKDYLLELSARVSSTSVQEERAHTEPPEEANYVLRYAFPLHYQISDDHGDVMLSDDTVVRWDEGERSQMGHVSMEGETQDVVQRLERLTAPRSGKMRVEAQIGADSTYGAQVEDPSLELYDAPTLLVLWPPFVLMFWVGPLLVTMGVAVLLLHWASLKFTVPRLLALRLALVVFVLAALSLMGALRAILLWLVRGS